MNVCDDSVVGRTAYLPQARQGRLADRHDAGTQRLRVNIVVVDEVTHVAAAIWPVRAEKIRAALTPGAKRAPLKAAVGEVVADLYDLS